MASENNQETSHKLSQDIRDTSLILQIDTWRRTLEHPNISNIYKNLWAEIEAQNGSPLYYGSEFWYITGIKKLFHHQKEKETTVEIIQNKLSYHQSPI